MLVLIFEEKKFECCENNCYNEFSSDEDLTNEQMYLHHDHW